MTLDTVLPRLSLLVIALALLAACAPDAAAPAAAPAPTRAAPAPSPAPASPSPPPPTATPVPPTPTPAPTSTSTPTSTPTPAPTATPNPLAAFAPAMRPGFEGDVAATGLPRYHLRLWADPQRGVLTGTEQIDFTNRADAPLTDIALRLYPNFSRDVFGRGGDLRMEVTGAAVAGQPVAASYAAQRTAVLLPLGQPLAPGAGTTVAVTFTATLRRADDGAWQLPAYYPMLAVREAGAWRLDVTRFADRVYAESALYEATIDVPAGLNVIATGSTPAVEARGERAIYRVVTGPVREFALAIGDFAVAQEQAGDVGVNVYTARGSRLDAGQIARVAASALAVFDRRFGPYPYRELDIHLLPGEHDGGDEYPGLILLTSDAQVDAGTRYVAAHEVAHQWWYGVIGNDIYRQPWLDEAFAQYSGIIYAEDAAGQAVAAADWEREVLRRYRGALADGDLPVGRAIDGYPSFNVYYRTVYGKGAVFLRALREDLGDDVFFRALQSYYGRHRYGVATTAGVRRAFEEAGGRDLTGLFRAWIGPE